MVCACSAGLHETLNSITKPKPKPQPIIKQLDPNLMKNLSKHEKVKVFKKFLNTKKNKLQSDSKFKKWATDVLKEILEK